MFIFWPIRLAVSLVSALLNLLVFVTCILTVTSFMGEKGWLWDLSSHFRMHYLVIQVVALVWGILRMKLQKKSRFEVLGTFVFLMVFIGLNLTQIAPYYFPRPKVNEADLQARVRILHINVLATNRNAQPVIQRIRDADPDILSIAEYSDWWRGALKDSGVLRRFPYKYVVSFGNDGFYSKIPFQSADAEYMREEGKVDPNTIVRMRWHGQPVTVLLTHPRPPLKPDWIQRSYVQYSRLIRERPQFDKNFIIVGDMNRTQWSELFRRLLYKTGLRDSQLGFGVQPTWPSMIHQVRTEINATKPVFPAWLGIPIDHVLVSEKFVVLQRKTGPFVGSDHLPVYVELGLLK